VIYYITKVSYTLYSLIRDVEAYKDDNNSLGECITLTRANIIQKINNGDVFYTITRNFSRFPHSNLWDFLDKVNLLKLGVYGLLRTDNQYIFSDYLGNLPLLLPRRKTFISYYHKDDLYYKCLFEFLFEDLIINKSVKDGDINKGNKDEYIKYLIQNGYLDDTSVLIILVSQKTKNRMHIDWEISGALNKKVGNNYAGLIGLHLPTHTEYGVNTYKPSLQPNRLADNANSGYAKIYDWVNDRRIIQNRIEDAYYGRDSRVELLDNSRIQMVADIID
jgi:hypothetical protein